MSLPSAPRMRTLYSSMAARDEASGRSVVVSLMCCGMTCLSNREIQACFRDCGELGPTGVGTASPTAPYLRCQGGFSPSAAGFEPLPTAVCQTQEEVG